MDDPGTILTTAAVTAYLAKDGVEKLLGPSCEYFGQKTKSLIERCDINLGNVIRNAINKVGDKINEPGSVNPRVLKLVSDEARFIENGLAVEYFGGVLASSRSSTYSDDTALLFLSAIKSMSTLELRAHYLIYMAIKSAYEINREYINISSQKTLDNMYVRIPFTLFKEKMEFGDMDDSHVITLHIIESLKRIGIVSNSSQYRFGANLQDISHSTLSISPTIYGINLLFWAYGIRHEIPNRYLSSSLKLDILSEIEIFSPDQLEMSKKLFLELVGRTKTNESPEVTQEKSQEGSGIRLTLYEKDEWQEVSPDIKFKATQLKNKHNIQLEIHFSKNKKPMKYKTKENELNYFEYKNMGYSFEVLTFHRPSHRDENERAASIEIMVNEESN